MKKGVVALLLLCTATFFGCARQTPILYIYCNETFWYVMQEEGLAFHKVYGFRVILLPIRVPRTSEGAETHVEIRDDNRTPAPWQSMPRNQRTVPQVVEAHNRIHPEIERQIERIAAESFGDLFLSDSQKQLEKLRTTALSANDFPVCYLTLTMLVPKENPHQFRSAKEVLELNRKLGIVDPSLDGLGEASWAVLSRIVPGGESAIPLEHVPIYERQYDLLEALEQKKIDAALVWNATSQVNFLLVKYAEEYNTKYAEYLRKAERQRNREILRRVEHELSKILVEEKNFAVEVPLAENPGERQVIAVRLVVLGSATNYDYGKRFADFMRSNQGKEILQRFGFVAE